MLNNATALSQQDFDIRDYIVNNLIKDLPGEAPEAFMHPISKTYRQSNGECTAYGTSHSSLIDNEKEHGNVVEIDPTILWADMGHQPKDKGGDSVENAVKTAVKMGLKGKLAGDPYIFQSDGWAYGKRDNRKEVCTKKPLISIIRGASITRREMIGGEIKTLVSRKQQTQGHCVVIAGYDPEYCYFYNSFMHNDGSLSKFKIKRDLMFQMMNNGALNRRYFVLVDHKDLQDYAIEKEVSKQMIKLAKKLYGMGDTKVKEYFEQIRIGDFLEKTYGFKYDS